LDIPPSIFELHALALRAFTDYERGEQKQPGDAATGVGDALTHLLNAAKATQQSAAKIDFAAVAQDLEHATIEPLLGCTQTRIGRLSDTLRWYSWHQLVKNMPDRKVVEEVILSANQQIGLADALRKQNQSSIEPSCVADCLAHVEQAYFEVVNCEELVRKAPFSIRAQLILWFITIVLAVVAIVLSLRK